MRLFYPRRVNWFAGICLTLLVRIFNKNRRRGRQRKGGSPSWCSIFTPPLPPRLPIVAVSLLQPCQLEQRPCSPALIRSHCVWPCSPQPRGSRCRSTPWGVSLSYRPEFKGFCETMIKMGECCTLLGWHSISCEPAPPTLFSCGHLAGSVCGKVRLRAGAAWEKTHRYAAVFFLPAVKQNIVLRFTSESRTVTFLPDNFTARLCFHKTAQTQFPPLTFSASGSYLFYLETPESTPHRTGVG